MGNFIFNISKDDNEEFVHFCKLPREVEILEYFVPGNKKFRQWFRRQCIISSKVYHRRICVKSNRALEQDRAIHLSQYYNIIHPFSSFRFFWELFTIILIVLQFLCIPITVVLMNHLFPIGMWIACGLQIITLSNVVVQFYSGYFEQSTRSIILERKNITQHYLKTYFVPDVIGNVPVEVIFYLIGYANIYCRTLLIIKVFFNIFTLIDYSEKYREKRQFPLCSYRLGQYITIFFLGILWTTGLIGVTVYIDQKVDFADIKWWTYINTAFVLLFGVGKTDWIKYGYELYVHFFAITFGFIMRNIIIAQMILAFKSYYSSKRKYSQLISELKEYIHFKRLPKCIKNKILKYYDFIFQQYYYNETEIWNLMPDKLKYEFEKNLYNIWSEANIFRACSEQIVQSLVMLVKKEIFLENDIIYEAGSLADNLYYLKYGTVTLHSDNEDIIVQETNFFADFALVLEETTYHNKTAIAQEDCEVYILHRENFREVIQHFPEAYKTILFKLNKGDHTLLNKPASRKGISKKDTEESPRKKKAYFEVPKDDDDEDESGQSDRRRVNL